MRNRVFSFYLVLSVVWASEKLISFKYWINARGMVEWRGWIIFFFVGIAIFRKCLKSEDELPFFPLDRMIAEAVEIFPFTCKQSSHPHTKPNCNTQPQAGEVGVRLAFLEHCETLVKPDIVFIGSFGAGGKKIDEFGTLSDGIVSDRDDYYWFFSQKK